jgi:single-stranded-DNA-specific exonuclease
MYVWETGDGSIANGTRFVRSAKLGNVDAATGQPLHVAGSLAADRWQGTERVQLRVLDGRSAGWGLAVIR